MADTAPKPTIASRVRSTLLGLASDCRKFADSAKALTVPEEHQAQIRVLDDILKYLSEHQREIGVIRKEMGHYNEALRKAKPKGKVLQTDSKPFQIEGKWYQLINGEPVVVETPTGNPLDE